MSTIEATLVAALADHYRLTRELGAGGMATVYLADDLKHQRQVAVKVLRPELAAALGAERFLREITTTANLRHPNILPLFDSGEGAGFLYYVMPFIEGETLRARLARESQLPLADALRIADEVADALGYAHGRGVVHRDIKPENIMLENGHAVVADFGIAHAVSAAGDEKLTSVGMALGTPHYMSPEQASGDEVDARSDLYALACVTYEMLAGAPPFTGRNAMAIMARHAMDPVPSLATVRTNVSGEVSAAIERALAKAPADRYATLAEWRAAIGASSSGTVAGALATGAAPRAAAIRKPPPVPSTPLLGREDALSTAIERVRQGARVLTISGYGGTGKTRFCIELFRRLEAGFGDGAAFVSLASVTASSDVMFTVGVALDTPEAHGRSALDAVATTIGERQVLLVLDNLEQVLAAAGDIASLVARCPKLQVIATSRAPLKIGAEVEFQLPPLELPVQDASDVDALLHCPSVALFVQRAQKVQPAFALTKANVPAVVGICRQLDGLPLALELAAARVRILPPAALLQRLDHALDLLTSGDRDLPLRQRTLRATISWSYSLLDEGEQRLLRRLSVFHEGWTFDAMEQVCDGDDDRHHALDELDSLVEKGLVRVMNDGDRYSLLETIRAFAAEQLHAGGEVARVRDAHVSWCIRFAESVSVGIKGTGQLDAMRRARAEFANTTVALHWLVSRARAGDAEAVERGLLLCGYLNWPWHITGLHATGRSFVDVFLALAADRPPSLGRALSRWTSTLIASVTGEVVRGEQDARSGIADAIAINDDALAAECAMAIGYLCFLTGKMDEARAALDDSLLRSRRTGSEFVEGVALTIKGLLLFVMGELDGGIALVESARRVQQRLGDYEGGGMALSFLAQMTFAKGDLVGARARYRESLDAFGLVGDRPEIARVYCEMGWTTLAADDAVQARACFARAVTAYEEVGSPRGTGLALLGLAAVEAAEGKAERAVAIATAASALSARAGVVIEHPMDPGVVERIEALKASIPKTALAGLENNARALTPNDVLAMVAG